MPNLVVIDAPSNLGLRPPEDGICPGVYKLAGALRDCSLVERLKAEEGGVVTPPRYRPEWPGGADTRNAAALATYSATLASRIGRILDQERTAIVLGGDCSILIGCALGLRQRGRFGLIFIDGHSDFRHPENSPSICAAAGEDLAIVTGRGDRRLIDIQKLKPYVRESDVVAIGVRPWDEWIDDMRRQGISVIQSDEIEQRGPEFAIERVRSHFANTDLDGIWIHLDLDVLDADVLPAVDSPEPHGLSVHVLQTLLSGLFREPNLKGIDITIYDPDLDPDRQYAAMLSNMLVAAFSANSPH